MEQLDPNPSKAKTLNCSINRTSYITTGILIFPLIKHSLLQKARRKQQTTTQLGTSVTNWLTGEQIFFIKIVEIKHNIHIEHIEILSPSYFNNSQWPHRP